MLFYIYYLVSNLNLLFLYIVIIEELWSSATLLAERELSRWQRRTVRRWAVATSVAMQALSFQMTHTLVTYFINRPGMHLYLTWRPIALCCSEQSACVYFYRKTWTDHFPCTRTRARKNHVTHVSTRNRRRKTHTHACTLAHTHLDFGFECMWMATAHTRSPTAAVIDGTDCK